MSLRFTRRSAAALLAGMAAWLRGAALAHEVSPRRKLLALFSEPERAAVIGARCLGALPPGQTAHDLVNALAGGDETGEALRRRIARQMRDDFAQGTMLDVEGWQLSLTEARLYALAALSARQGRLYQA